MSGLIAARATLVARGAAKRIGGLQGRLGPGLKAFEGGLACIDSANPGVIVVAGISTTLKPIGIFQHDADNSAGSGTMGVGIEFFREKELYYWDSVGGPGAITVADLYQTVYIASDHELTTVSTGASPYGIVWTFTAANGLGQGGVGAEAIYA